MYLLCYRKFFVSQGIGVIFICGSVWLCVKIVYATCPEYEPPHQVSCCQDLASPQSQQQKYAWSVPTLIRDTGFSFFHRDVFETFAHPFSPVELRGVGGCPKLEMGLSPILRCHKFWSATSLRNLGTRSCLNSSLQLLT